MYAALMFWEQTHRGLIWAVIAVSLWVGTYFLYLRQDIGNYLKHRRAARWGVDMATKTVTSGRRPVA